MKFTTCGQVLSAALLASSTSLPVEEKRVARHVSSHKAKISAISWDEAVKIMEGVGGRSKAKIPSTIDPDETEPIPTCSDVKVRVEWSNMADTDKLSFVQSVKCLMDAKPIGVWANATSIWDEITWVHDQLNERIHGVDAFLPWHRYYLHMLKTLLEERCEYKGPMPWWRETNYTGNFAGSGLFTPEYFGALPPISDKGEGTCITDGVSEGPCISHPTSSSLIETDELHPPPDLCQHHDPRRP